MTKSTRCDISDFYLPGRKSVFFRSYVNKAGLASICLLILEFLTQTPVCIAQNKIPQPPKKVNSSPVFIDPKVGINDTIILPAYIVNGDTLAHIWIGNVDVADRMIYHNEEEKQNYLRLKRDVLTVLPYARYAGYRFKVLQAQLAKETDPRKKKQLIKDLEKEIKQNYVKSLTNLTITQGRILIKLVDRETGQTSFDIVKEMKSGFSAFIFQSVAGLFGDNLKDHYDAAKDKDIEFIIQSMGYY